MSGQVLRGSAGEYQADERAGVARLLASIRLMSGQVLRGSAGEYQAENMVEVVCFILCDFTTVKHLKKQI